MVCLYLLSMTIFSVSVSSMQLLISLCMLLRSLIPLTMKTYKSYLMLVTVASSVSRALILVLNEFSCRFRELISASFSLLLSTWRRIYRLYL